MPAKKQTIKRLVEISNKHEAKSTWIFGSYLISSNYNDIDIAIFVDEKSNKSALLNDLRSLENAKVESGFYLKSNLNHRYHVVVGSTSEFSDGLQKSIYSGNRVWSRN